MRIGVIGLGKLGLPVALAIESRGFLVSGWDVSSDIQAEISKRSTTSVEPGVAELLRDSDMQLQDIPAMVAECSLILVAVQTPHQQRFEGTTPLTEERADFDYTYVASALRALAEAVAEQRSPRAVVLISTVLPGTVRREFIPLLAGYGVTELIQIVYNPFFIAMGSVIADFFKPEFVVAGTASGEPSPSLEMFYRALHPRPVFWTTYENAELVKMSYNTFIGMKVAFGNIIMELCHKIPHADCDVVHAVLSHANERLISTRYLKGGMGDGGPCHPRDNIALSWLARETSLSHDFFDDIMKAREDGTRWLCTVIQECVRSYDLPVVLLGLGYKDDCGITSGSAAVLLAFFLREAGVSITEYDPFVTPEMPRPRQEPSIYFLAARHACWADFTFFPGSVVLDPFGAYGSNLSLKAVKYIPIGRQMQVQE